MGFDIGTKVTVDLNQINDRLPDSLRLQINSDPSGKVVDYKMTDGMGIGIIVQFNSGRQSWFFLSEIKESKSFIENTEKDYEDSLIKLIGERTSEFNYSTNKEIKYLLNPINFFSWFIFSIKDNI